jgi:hypothetical protein
MPPCIADIICAIIAGFIIIGFIIATQRQASALFVQRTSGATHASCPACFPACSPACRPSHHGPFPFPGYYPCLRNHPSGRTEAHRYVLPCYTLHTRLRLDRAARIRRARLRARLDRSIRRQRGHGVHPRVRRACRICCSVLREAPTSDCARSGGRMRTLWYQFVRVPSYTRAENGRDLLSLEFARAYESAAIRRDTGKIRTGR